MANEFTITQNLVLANGFLTFKTPLPGFRPSQSVANGPSPGAIVVTTGGVNINLSQLTLAGITQLQNVDATNYVTIGLYESSGTIFRPFIELLPGEIWTFRLSRSILTANTAADVVRAVANTASVVLHFNAFDT